MTELVPIPCRRCGAPMSEASTGAAGGTVAMICSFCGTEEGLPAEPSARVQALRERLRQIAWTEHALEAPALSAARTLEAVRSMVVPATVLLVGFPTVMAGVSLLGRERIDLGAILSVSLTPLVGLALVCGVHLGSFLALRAYRRELVPELLAFAPTEPNGAARCRRCGGDLPMAGHSGFVACRYCSTQNLVTPELARRSAADLDRELEHHRARAAGMTSQVATAHAKLRKRMTLATVVGAALAVAVGLAGTVFVQALSAP